MVFETNKVSIKTRVVYWVHIEAIKVYRKLVTYEIINSKTQEDTEKNFKLYQ